RAVMVCAGHRRAVSSAEQGDDCRVLVPAEPVEPALLCLGSESGAVLRAEDDEDGDAELPDVLERVVVRDPGPGAPGVSGGHDSVELERATLGLVRGGLQRGLETGAVLPVSEIGEVAIEEREALLLSLCADLRGVELAGSVVPLDVAREDRPPGDDR